MNTEPKKRGNPNFGKKGKPSWKPASLNEFIHKEDGYRYRMVSKDPVNLAKKVQEGWEKVSKIESPLTEQISPERINDGKQLSSVVEGHDWILHRIPEEVAQQRDEYYNYEAQRRTMGLTAHLRKEMQTKAGNAPVHGDITISSLRGTQVIE